jgi:hypothetical protein
MMVEIVALLVAARVLLSPLTDDLRSVELL